MAVTADAKHDKTGVYTTTGKPIIERPPQETLARLRRDPRIGYMPFILDKSDREPERPYYPKPLNPLSEARAKQLLEPWGDKWEPPWVSWAKGWDGSDLGIGIRIITERGNLRPSSILSKIKSEFKDKFPVGIRGTACSIDGTIDLTAGSRQKFVLQDKNKIKDINEILSTGTEKTIDRAMLVPIDDSVEELSGFVYRWLFEHAVRARKDLESVPELASRVFPALEIYDFNALTTRLNFNEVIAKNWGGVDCILPNAKEALEKLILKIFIFDYPHVTFDGVV
jgi:hypothetical protein